MQRASTVFLCSDDRVNLAGMDILRGMEPTAHTSPMRVFLRVGNSDLKRELVAREGVFSSTKLMSFEPFNTHEMAARQLFHSNDIFLEAAKSGQVSVHWLCLGWSSSIAALVEQLARVSPFPGADQPKITVLTDDPAKVRAVLNDRFNVITDHVTWQVELWNNSDIKPSAEQFDKLASANPITSIILAETLRAGTAIAAQIEGEMARKVFPFAPIWLCDPALALFPGVATMTIHSIPSLDQIMQPAQFLGGMDQVARQFHDAYCNYSGNATVWEDLDENLRNANRRAADHAKTKLEAMGYGGAILEKRADLDQRLTQNLEVLARAEHDAWMIDRLMSGWRFGETRSDANRIHPNLIPYDDLSEHERNLDRWQVQQLLKLKV